MAKGTQKTSPLISPRKQLAMGRKPVVCKPPSKK